MFVCCCFAQSFCAVSYCPYNRVDTARRDASLIDLQAGEEAGLTLQVFSDVPFDAGNMVMVNGEAKLPRMAAANQGAKADGRVFEAEGRVLEIGLVLASLLTREHDASGDQRCRILATGPSILWLPCLAPLITHACDVLDSSNPHQKLGRARIQPILGILIAWQRYMLKCGIPIQIHTQTNPLVYLTSTCTNHFCLFVPPAPRRVLRACGCVRARIVKVSREGVPDLVYAHTVPEGSRKQKGARMSYYVPGRLKKGFKL